MLLPAAPPLVGGEKPINTRVYGNATNANGAFTPWDLSGGSVHVHILISHEAVLSLSLSKQCSDIWGRWPRKHTVIHKPSIFKYVLRDPERSYEWAPPPPPEHPLPKWTFIWVGKKASTMENKRGWETEREGESSECNFECQTDLNMYRLQ